MITNFTETRKNEKATFSVDSFCRFGVDGTMRGWRQRRQRVHDVQVRQRHNASSSDRLPGNNAAKTYFTVTAANNIWVIWGTGVFICILLLLHPTSANL